MDNLFLPRDVGSIETGSQTFAGTNVLGMTFNFNPYPSTLEEIGLLNSVLIQNAGLVTLNGLYDYITEIQNKPYYSNYTNTNLFIIWLENEWRIYDIEEENQIIYASSEDVYYPWNVINWIPTSPIYEPAPIVAKIL